MNVWRVVAIIFIILFVVETSLVIWLMSIGFEAMDKETECQVNICASYDSYYIDSQEDICYCYQNNEIVKQEFLK